MELVLSHPETKLGPAVPDVVPEPPECFPLSFAQQRLWFLSQLNPKSPAYNIPAAFELSGPLDPEALRKSFEAIVARHEILRTVYVAQEGEPRQRVLSPPHFDLPRVNLTQAALSEETLAARLRAEAAAPFALETDLPLRAKLFELGPDRHVLFLNAHHIAFDEWSMPILWRELAAGYAAFRAGFPPEVDELPIQYADFAIWQRESSPGSAASEDYWREQLKGPLPRLRLPANNSATDLRSDRGSRQELVLSPDFSDKVRDFARQEHVTTHALFLAGFLALLRRQNHGDDLIVGVPAAGRAHFQTEPLIGFFVNILPIRVGLSDEVTFRELLRRAARASLEACDHQDLPFDRIVETARAARLPGQNPIFDVVFSTQRPPATWDFGGLSVEAIELETGTSKFDLTFVVQERASGLRVVAEYSVDLFRREQIRQLLCSYEMVLRALVANPDQPAAQLGSRAEPATVRAEAAEAPSRQPSDALPQTRLQRKLREVWALVLGHDSFGPTDNFFEIGGHSLLAVKLIAQIEKAFGKKLDLSILFRAPTLEKLAEVMAGDIAPSLGSCLVEIQPRGSKPPIFWLHTLGGGGGGGLFTYRKLAEELGPEQPSYGFVSSGQPFDRIEAMAARYIQEMRALQPEGPYRLGGYCFGGVVAYEMACQLETAGQQVSVLALLDSSPPDPLGHNGRPSLKLAWHALVSLPAWLCQLDRESVKKNWQRLRARLARPRSALGAAAPQLEQFVDMTHYPADYRRFAQAHWNALMRYTPGPYHGPAILFKTDERHLFRLDSVNAWRRLVGRGLEIRRVTGKHEQILAPPHVEKLAAQLRQILA